VASVVRGGATVVDGAGAGAEVVIGAGAAVVLGTAGDVAVVETASADVTVVDGASAARWPDDPQAVRTTRARRMATARAHERPTGHYLTKW